jgi:hypothetical protein
MVSMYHALTIGSFYDHYSASKAWIRIGRKAGILNLTKLQVAALPLMIGHYMHRSGLPENVASCHMGGLYVSSFFLGSFLGPILGGFLIGKSSYGTSCTASGGINLMSVAIVGGLHLLTGTFLYPWQNERHTQLSVQYTVLETSHQE